MINYRSDPEGAENVAQFIREKYGVEVLLVCGDASKEETVDKIFDKAMEKYGTVDTVSYTHLLALAGRMLFWLYSFPVW